MAQHAGPEEVGRLQGLWALGFLGFTVHGPDMKGPGGGGLSQRCSAFGILGKAFRSGNGSLQPSSSVGTDSIYK